MRFLLWMWFAPLAFFWSWYVLAVNDVGYIVLSREMYDRVFEIYGGMLGVDPAIIPAWLARVCIIDSAVVLGIFAFVRRRRIAEWWNRRGQSDTSLSSAP